MKKADLYFRQMNFRATVIKDDPRTGVREGTRRGALCLLAILQARFKAPPEAELSPDLSRDHGAITTRWINTRVVKVKWCYVVRCYWTWPVKIHDTDTLSRPLPAPRCRMRPCRDPKKKVRCWSLLPLDRWTVSAHAESRWQQQLPNVSDTI